MKPQVTKYTLEKNSSVEIHKVFGDEYYFALVKMDGRYPEEGKIAHNLNRSEYMYVLEGHVNVTVNKKTFPLNKGEYCLVEDGDYYTIEGKAETLVFVKDGKGGTSQIEPLDDK